MGIVLTNNAQFKPYTFDEMLKPLAMVTQEYNAIEEGIAELGTKADLMRMYANEEPNSEWAKKYNEYANDLDKQAESLAKYGLNPASRQGLLNLKRAYSSSVSPIEEAAKARKEAYKYRDTIRAKDNTAMFRNSTLSLSDFMNGKEGDNTYISGKDVMTRVASKAQIEGTNMFNALLEKGYSSEAALQAVDNWSRSVDNPIIAEELKAIGYENYSPEDQAKLMNSIGTGMYNAASEIAKGEYLTKKERESIRLQEKQLKIREKEEDGVTPKVFKDKEGKQWMKIKGLEDAYTDGQTIITGSVLKEKMGVVTNQGSKTPPIKQRNLSTGLEVDVSKWNNETLPNYFIDNTGASFKEGVDNRDDWKEIMSKPTGIPISVKQIPDDVLAALEKKNGEYYQYYKVEKDGEIIGYRAIPLSKPAAPSQEGKGEDNKEEEEDKNNQGGASKASRFPRK